MVSEPQAPPQRPNTNLATASLALGIIGIPTLGLLTVGAIVGIALGAIALRRANRDPTRYGGRGIAIAGMVICGFSLVAEGLLSFLIIVFIAQPVKVEGTAMQPTLHNGDKIFVWKAFDEIERGDIVVFWYPKDPSKSFIKRVVGLPGETLRIDQEGQLYIDNQRMDEPYLSDRYNHDARSVPETYIEPHYYWVMGDNRDASNDSRSWGTVPEKYIYGKFAGRYYSAE